MSETVSAFVFPGQGQQSAGIVEEIVADKTITDLIEFSSSELGYDVIDRVRNDFDRAIQVNEVASVLAVLHSISSLGKVRQHGVRPDFCAGYSVGQYSAMHAAGMISDHSVVRLVIQRSRMMDHVQQRHGPGGMLAVVGLPTVAVEKVCTDISTSQARVEIGNYNAEGNVTVSGDADAIERAREAFADLPLRQVADIPVSGAWHCFVHEPTAVSFEHVLFGEDFAEPDIPVMDNVTGQVLPASGAVLHEQLKLHLHKAVRWRDCVNTLKKLGATRAIEVGFGTMLCKFGFFIDRELPHLPYARLMRQAGAGSA